MQKLRQFCLMLFASSMLMLVFLMPAALAANPTPPPSDPYGPKIGPSIPDVTADDGKINAALTIVFTITGALSLLFFVAGGLRYVTSQGDPQQISKAKGTLIYALVGLLVSISAVSIVTFVLGRL